MSTAHPALESEQAYIAEAYDLLRQGLADSERSFEDFQPTHKVTAQAMQRALAILHASRGSGQLVFGRLDRPDESLYIGRRRVYDRERNLKVIGWHAPAAAPYYQVSRAEPHDVLLKRVFTEQDQVLHSIVDEIVRESAASAVDPGHDSPVTDALLNELNRTRDGAMREVVSTIQAEQFAIIRGARDEAIVVQGGPGTGKSVVGLHRAAWLTFNHPELQRGRILVVAPTPGFLNYVAGVLPSLDVADIDQVDVDSLYQGEVRPAASEDLDVARVKGSPEMAVVLAKALRQRVRPDTSDLELRFGVERVTVPSSRLAELIDATARTSSPHNEGRDAFRDALAAEVLEVHALEQRQNRRQVRVNEAAIRRLTTFTNAVDRMWPSFSPEEMLRSLYGTQTWLTAACDGILPGDERALLFRQSAESVYGEPWTSADMPCLDELAALLYGHQLTYGHLVVDEAQDLSPMVARMLARRCPSGSMTVLGDLGQATGAWIRDDWEELTTHLTDRTPTIRSLSIGYRVPREVLSLAAKQLAMVGSNVPVPTSIRAGLGAPTAHASTSSLHVAALNRAEALAAAGLTTALIVPDQLRGDIVALGGTNVADAGQGDFSKQISVLTAEESKGLEFDAVVLVEPLAIASESPQGSRLLYVAMTRCTQTLEVVYSDVLPSGFESLGPTANVVGVENASANGDAIVGVAPRAELLEAIERLTAEDAELVRTLIARLGNVDTGDFDDD